MRPQLFRSTTLTVLLVFTGCSSPAPASESGAASPAPGGRAPIMGTFTTGDTTQQFRGIQCDLSGTAQDNLLLRGSGTMPNGDMLTPDGRRLGIEVERMSPGLGGNGMLYERVTIQFGGFEEEDGWEATATSMGGGRWTSQDSRVLDGPIIQVDGNTLSVTATFTTLSGESSQAGTLRVTCPAAGS